jgi:antibiotic biosynthesis monooxygenase (ABM) superfamily enzyme
VILTAYNTMSSLHVSIRPEALSRFVIWQGIFGQQIAASPGFVSLEYLCSSPHENRWIIVERFSDESNLQNWQNSANNQKRIKELRDLATLEGVTQKVESEPDLKSGVTEVIITHVPVDKEVEFRQWNAKIHSIEAKFEGFRGIYVQSPAQQQSGNWITLLQFDTPQNLDRWLNSSERQEVLKESASLVHSYETHRVASPYAGWFYTIPNSTEAPPVWKQTMLVLLVLFPIVMLQSKYLSPWLVSLNPSLGIFLSCLMSVTLITFPFMPLAISGLRWWIAPTTQWLNITGTLTVILLFTFEILLFWI